MESEFLRHDSCPDCGSSDALAVYSGGTTFCFSCHTWTGNGNQSHSSSPNNTMTIPLSGRASPLNNRGISEVTCEKFKIYRDGSVLKFYYYKDGQPIGAKVKTADKNFTYEGSTEGTFFGQHLFPSQGKRIVITEGELDCVSVWEAMPNWPVVSLPSGAASAKKSIQRNLEFLQGYETIVLFFDNDQAGREAAKEAASVLPPGKVKISALTDDYKDASDALQAKDTHAICKAIWDAREFRPDGIVDGKSLLELVTTPQADSDHKYPFEGLNEKLHGIRLGELTCITAGSGIGKSSFCRQIAAGLLESGERVGYLALEESNRRTALGLMSVGVEKALHLGDPSHDELTDAFDKTMANWNCYLFDGFGSYDPDVIYNRIEYLASGLETKIVFLDHLSILLSGLDGDERKTIDQTMTRLRSLVERTGIHLFLVSHLRRSQKDEGHEEGARVSLSQLRGSASIAQLSDSVIGLERNQQSNDDASGTTCRVIKNRYSGETGVACVLDYDLKTCKFSEAKGFDPSTDF